MKNRIRWRNNNKNYNKHDNNSVTRLTSSSYNITFSFVPINTLIILLCLWNEIPFIESWLVQPTWKFPIILRQHHPTTGSTYYLSTNRIRILSSPITERNTYYYHQLSQLYSFQLSLVGKSNIDDSSRQSSNINSSISTSSQKLSALSNKNKLERIMEKYGYKTNRFQILKKEQLPVLAEVYINGQSALAYITSFVPIPRSSSIVSSIVEPKFVIETVVSSSDDQSATQQQLIVDFGQITTIWENPNERSSISARPIDTSDVLRQIHDKVITQLPNIPDELLESIFDRVYTNYAGRARLSSKGINKKQISTIVQKTFGGATDQDDRTIVQHADNVLRKIVKAGTSYCRIIDSMIISQQYLYNSKIPIIPIPTTTENNNNSPKKRKVTINVRSKSQKQQEQQFQQALAARIVSDDAKIGGRFKRWSCIFLSSASSSSVPNNTYTDTNNENNDDGLLLEIDSISYINGGWLVVDRTIRATEEARKFTERISISDNNPVVTTGSSDNNNNNNNDGDGTTTKQTNNKKATKLKVATRSDERIIRRLECLAMGEILQSTTTGDDDNNNNNNNNDSNNNNNNNKILELDVRETLKQMKLPLSSDGAKEALIRIGHWSPNTISGNKRFLPWSKQVLQAAAWYIDADQKRSTTFHNYFNRVNGSRDDNTLEGNNNWENRVDMTKYPSICIDAERTAFRDDAFSIRYRRDNPKFRDGTNNDDNSQEKSKYELLIHIADVSDIYVRNSPPGTMDLPQDHKDEYLQTLREAAASRGSSRYDLPFGPLHLLPPVILESLSFATKKQYNRCITLWVYMNEETGDIIDAGFERSIISSPSMLSYQDASDIMDGKNDESSSNVNQRIRALLLVAERMLLQWNTNRQKQNVVAQKREARLASRAAKYQNHGLAIDETNLPPNASFRRSRGHRLVDSYLDLHSVVAFDLCQRNRTPLPQVIGADASRGGRIATAPLRRYIDGVAQTQLLAAFLNHGQLMTPTECREAGKIAAGALRSISNVRSIRNA